jgi:hypothetical protein
MTLKERLDAVWADKRCACPNHLCRWNSVGIGHTWFDKNSLYYTKGKRMVSRKTAKFVQSNIKKFKITLD